MDPIQLSQKLLVQLKFAFQGWLRDKKMVSLVSARNTNIVKKNLYFYPPSQVLLFQT